MGWSFYSNPVKDVEAEIKNLCTHDTSEVSQYPVHISNHGSTWYVAVKTTFKKKLRDNLSYKCDSNHSYIFAAVFLTRRDNGEWGYKAMDESMGPYEADAPRKLIKMLSPTSCEYANKWREKCLRSASLKSRKIVDGDIIEFSEPLSFTDGSTASKFRVVKEAQIFSTRKKTVFVSIDTGKRCRIQGFSKLNWTKLAERQGALVFTETTS